MRLMQRLTGLSILVALAAALLSPMDSVYGQTPGSPVEQLLQGLTPDQMSAISQQLGGTGLGGATQGAQGGAIRPTPQSEEQQSLVLQQQREVLMEQQKQRGEMQRLSPFLRAEDWVVITIDSNPLPAGNAPPPTAVPGGERAALGAIGGAPSQQQQNILGNLAPAIAAQQAQSSGTGGAQGAGTQSGLA